MAARRSIVNFLPALSCFVVASVLISCNGQDEMIMTPEPPESNCQVFFTGLRDWTQAELEDFCRNTGEFPVYVNHREITDTDGINATAIYCCRDTGSQR